MRHVARVEHLRKRVERATAAHHERLSGVDGLRTNPAKASVSRHRGKKSVGEFERLLSLGARPVWEGPGTRLPRLGTAVAELSSAHNATFTTCDHLAVQ